MTSRRRAFTNLVWLGVVVSGGIVSSLAPLFTPAPTTWMGTYGTENQHSFADDITATNEEFVVIINNGKLMGLSGRGTVHWTHSFNSTAIQKVSSTSNGGLVAVGHTLRSGATLNEELYLYHLDAQRRVVWERTYAPPNAHYAQILFPSVIQTADGGFVVVALVNEVRTWLWLIHVNAYGSPLWNVSAREYPAYGDVIPQALLQTPERDFVIAGLLYDDEDAMLLYILPSGVPLWNHTYGGSRLDVISSLIQTSDGDFVLAGYANSFGAGDRDAWLIRTDADGIPRWNQTYGGAQDDVFSSLVQTSTGDFVLAGYTNSFGAGDRDAWLIRTDADGIPRWNQTYGGLESDYVSTVLQATDGGFILAGTTYSFGVGNSSAWVFKTDSLGQFFQIPDLTGVLMVTGWGTSLVGALALGITVADHILTSRKAKEHSPTNSRDTDS
ncbi:MAG: hypothetical protein ACFFC7_23125 [Candidatus Hermodarchaeota archaeon]